MACSSSDESGEIKGGTTTEGTSSTAGFSGTNIEPSTSSGSSEESGSTSSGNSFTGDKLYSLTVELNIEVGSALVIESADKSLAAFINGINCPPKKGYYTCELELKQGAYIVAFQNADGYSTPPPALVQLDGVDDVIAGDYLLSR